MNRVNKVNKKRKTDINSDPSFKKFKLNRSIGLMIIQDLFDMYDENANRQLDQVELKKVLNGLGCYVSDNELTELMREIDKDGSGNIDIQEFIEVFGKTHLNSNYFIEQYIDRAFELYDKDSDGFISERDLHLCGEELGNQIDDNEVNILFKITKLFSNRKKLENPENDLISKEEFINMLCEIGFIEDASKDIDNNITALNNGPQTFIKKFQSTEENKSIKNADKKDSNPMGNQQKLQDKSLSGRK